MRQPTAGPFTQLSGGRVPLPGPSRLACGCPSPASKPPGRTFSPDSKTTQLEEPVARRPYPEGTPKSTGRQPRRTGPRRSSPDSPGRVPVRPRAAAVAALGRKRTWIRRGGQTRRLRVGDVLPAPAPRAAEPRRRRGRTGRRRGRTRRRPRLPPRTRSRDPTLPRVSIFLSVFDVHVQRSPVAGTVHAVMHEPGKFHSADLADASEENERNSHGDRDRRWPRHRSSCRSPDCSLAASCATPASATGSTIGRHLRPDPLRVARRHLLPGRYQTCSSSVGQRADRRRNGHRGAAGDHAMSAASASRRGRPAAARPIRLLPSVITILALCVGPVGDQVRARRRARIALRLIGAAAILDALDGRIARLLDATSKMGAELDSLSDAISFGVAPALVLYVDPARRQPVRLDHRARSTR